MTKVGDIVLYNHLPYEVAEIDTQGESPVYKLQPLRREASKRQRVIENVVYTNKLVHGGGDKISNVPEADIAPIGKTTATTLGVPDGFIRITFDVFGEIYEFQDIESGGKFTAFTDPEVDHYTFGGWYTAPDGEGTQKTTSSTFSTDTVLYAKMTIDAFKVEFDIGSGTGTVATQTVDYGDFAQEPETPPTYVGHDFLGWYTAGDETGKLYEFDSTPVVANITLYAKYIEVHSVDFEMNSHGEAVETQSVRDGGVVEEPEPPTDEGWIFEGWYTDDNTFDELYDFTTPVTEAFTLYAKWEQEG